MTTGTRIEFFIKRAEELKKEEKPVDAPVSASPETTTEDKVVVKVDEKKPTDVESTDSTEEKSAAESANNKALEIATKAGRPTSTGLAAGAGLGTIMAALGALHRSNSDEDKTSVLSNPLLLGALGTAAGYAGGNMLHEVPVRKPKEQQSLKLPSLAAALGTLGVGAKLSKMDDLQNSLSLQTKIERLRNKGTPIMQGKKLVGHDITKLSLKDQLELERLRKKLRGAMIGLNREERMFESKNLDKNITKLDKILHSHWSPARQLRALNPLKTLENGASGARLFKKQLFNALINKPWVGKGSLRALPPRLAALTALSGLTTAGVNAVRNVKSKD